ncbi:MAG: hypothetical protein QM755_21420 [Luteolibacter sp.]
MKVLLTPVLAAVLMLQAGNAGAQQVTANMQLGSSSTGRDSVAPKPLAQKPDEAPTMRARSLLFLLDSLPGEVFRARPRRHQSAPGSECARQELPQP